MDEQNSSPAHKRCCYVVVAVEGFVRSPLDPEPPRMDLTGLFAGWI